MTGNLGDAYRHIYMRSVSPISEVHSNHRTSHHGAPWWEATEILMVIKNGVPETALRQLKRCNMYAHHPLLSKGFGVGPLRVTRIDQTLPEQYKPWRAMFSTDQLPRTHSGETRLPTVLSLIANWYASAIPTVVGVPSLGRLVPSSV